ncbi:hypothetical protein V8C35DRAFT_10106 [Trichoderma chlorosporum]
MQWQGLVEAKSGKKNKLREKPPKASEISNQMRTRPRVSTARINNFLSPWSSIAAIYQPPGWLEQAICSTHFVAEPAMEFEMVIYPTILDCAGSVPDPEGTTLDGVGSEGRHCRTTRGKEAVACLWASRGSYLRALNPLQTPDLLHIMPGPRLQTVPSISQVASVPSRQAIIFPAGSSWVRSVEPRSILIKYIDAFHFHCSNLSGSRNGCGTDVVLIWVISGMSCK